VAPATPQQPDVELRGPHPGDRLGGRVPCVVTSEAAYRGLAEAWGIKSPPAVNFRTHFLFVQVSNGYGPLNCEIVGGDLRVVGGQAVDDLKSGYLIKSSGYLIKSFRRSAVKTVNGQPLPKD
jgi:hypothetical protein